MYAALVGKEQQIGMGAGYHYLLDKILLAGSKSGYTLAAAALGAVGIAGQTLDISEVGHGYYHILLLD